MPDALQMLKDDHRKVKEIFKQFEQAEEPKEKKRLADEAIMELVIHEKIEEEIFYPAVRREVQPEGDLMEEAAEEHHVVDLLIAELQRMRPTAANYSAKFTVLAENVKHHIEEEESQMLTQAAEMGSARLRELGEEMEQRKMQLQSGYRAGGTRGRTTTKRTGSRNGATRTRRATSPRRTTRTKTTRTTRARTGTSTRSRSTGARGSSTRSASTRPRSASSRSRSTGTRRAARSTGRSRK